MNDFKRSDDSTKNTDTHVLAGPATRILIGGSGDTDTPINTGCTIQTPSLVQDANGNTVYDGVVYWSMSTSPHMPNFNLSNTRSRNCVMTGPVTKSCSLTMKATYLNLTTSKTIPVKAIVPTPHNSECIKEASITLKVKTPGIRPEEAYFYTVRYERPGGPGLGLGTLFPNVEFTTRANPAYPGLNTVYASLRDSRLNYEARKQRSSLQSCNSVLHTSVLQAKFNLNAR